LTSRDSPCSWCMYTTWEMSKKRRTLKLSPLWMVMMTNWCRILRVQVETRSWCRVELLVKCGTQTAWTGMVNSKGCLRVAKASKMQARLDLVLDRHQVRAWTSDSKCSWFRTNNRSMKNWKKSSRQVHPVWDNRTCRPSKEETREKAEASSIPW
jgi:hypothetical protein